MPPKDDKATVAEPMVLEAPVSMEDQLRQAFMDRDAAAGAYYADEKEREKAVAQADAAVQRLVHTYNSVEDFDPSSQPVMAELAKRARSKQAAAVRLLLQDRKQIKLQQKPANEPQLPGEQIGINGLIIDIPRGKSILVPVTFANIIDESEIY